MLESAFTAAGEKNSARAILIKNEESLHCQYKGYWFRIEFNNDTTKDQVNNTDEQHHHYNI